MLSYPVEEAETLLEGKLQGAEQSLENVEEDLDFLREQITVSRLHEFCWAGMLTGADTGGCSRQSIQLGCDYEAERKGRKR